MTVRDRAIFEEAYNKLNQEQKQAVDTIEGPVMVVAGPGTGKTTMLTLRIAKILMETDTAPESVLALTFTNTGVRAMRDKLHNYIGDEAYRVNIHTFHSFAEHILTRFAHYFPEYENARVIGDLEKVKLIENILEEGAYQNIVSVHDPFSSLTQVVKAIDTIKREGLSPNDFSARIPLWEQNMMNDESMFYKRKFGTFNPGDIKPTELDKVKKKVAKAAEVADVFAAYQTALRKHRRYDFSDMILTVLERLAIDSNLKLDLQEQYQYLLVDEHQDTNDGQNRLIEYLTDAEHLGGRPNLFTVGDEKQSIYRFQGASAESFTHLQSRYSDVLTIELTQNYRSSKSVLAAAQELIVRTVPRAKILSANIAHDKPISVARFSDYKFELLFAVSDIKNKIEAGANPSDIAVIYRSNKHLAELKILLHDLGIPYNVLSKDTLFDDPKIAMFITLLETVNEPHADELIAKLLFAEFLRLPALQNANLLREYSQHKRQVKDQSSLLDFLSTKVEYQSLLELLSTLKSYEANHTFLEFFKEALHTSGFLASILSSANGQAGLHKIDALFSEVKRQADEKSDYGLSDFLTFIAAEHKYGLDIEVTAAGRPAGVCCLTAHKAKGLEFEHVYLINTTRSNWEKSRGFNNLALPISDYQGELDDERRLFYVAMTRAKTHLHISTADMDWHGKPLEPSQFISELDHEVIEDVKTRDFELKHQDDLERFLSNTGEELSVFSLDFLSQAFLTDNLSVTALNNFIACPIKYLLRNLLRLPDAYTPAQRYGDAMHKTLEAFFTTAAQTQKVGTKASLLTEFTKAISMAGFRETEHQRYQEKGKTSLSAYYDAYHQTWLTTVSLEEYIRRSFSLASGEVINLSGKIDKLVFATNEKIGPVTVVDYKTGKAYSEKTKLEKEALDRQIIFYHLLLAEYKTATYEVAGAVLDFVEPNKKGKFEQQTVVVTKEELQKLEAEIQSMAAAVLNGSFLEQGCRKKDCESCAFYHSLGSHSAS